MTLADFLMRRIAEDEAAARAAAAAPRPRGGWGSEEPPAGEQWETRRGGGMLYTPSVENPADAALWDDEGGCDYMSPAPEVGHHMARHDPARVLAECDAKRRIVESLDLVNDAISMQEMDGGGRAESRDLGERDAIETTLAHLAAVYSEHPDYREAWST